MDVSVVIPAYNAAATLAETLQSLVDQSFTNWEAIIIDDGSSDTTAVLADRYRSQDPRFKLLTQQRKGVSVARNAGIQAARFDWLLFLDADDWILPRHLERLTALLTADPSLDAAVCGWAHVTSDGEFVFEQYGGLTGDLFAAHGRYCYSLIHTYLVRRSLVEVVGGFDTSFRTCEDWDLFQRIARTGARFGGVPETLAAYRMRAGSATTNGRQLLKDGLRVLDQGHAPDRRVAVEHPVYPEGLPRRGLPRHRYGLACACAGYVLGGGGDARPLLERLKDEQQSNMNAYEVAQAIFIHAMVAAARPMDQWQHLCATLEPRLRAFLLSLEIQSGSRGLTRKVCLYFNYLGGHYAKGRRMRLSTITAQLQRGWDLAVQQGHKKTRLAKRLLLVILSIIPEWERRAFAAKQFVQSRLQRSQSQPSQDLEHHFEALFKKGPDPWGYTNVYEQNKYEQTLDLLPNGPIGEALELACAEGYFTRQLAPRVQNLIANDISRSALKRAAERCRDFDNIEFQCFDFMKEPIPGSFDLIVCSEVLYYSADIGKLKQLAHRLAKSLKIGGHLLTAHANVVIDDPSQPGFDLEHKFGARVIGETFSAVPELQLVSEAHSALYRIHLFQRTEHAGLHPKSEAVIIRQLPLPDPLPDHIASQVQWVSSRQLYILRYLYISDAAKQAGYVRPVSVPQFQAQLRYLSDNHYRSISLDEWHLAREYGIPLAGKPVFIVFDDATLDFSTHALPLLQQYGFDSTVLLTTDDLKKGLSRSGSGDNFPQLTWKELRHLQSEGVVFGARPSRQSSLVSLPLAEARRIIKTSRSFLDSELGIPTSLFAYPGGDCNRRLQFLTGACGFDFALSELCGPCTTKHSAFALPHITVTGADSIREFAAKLTAGKNTRHV
ncbi:MAG: glycosyltransferase [Pseudomonadota bacterium]